jgi:hypothetical protein
MGTESDRIEDLNASFHKLCKLNYLGIGSRKIHEERVIRD